MALLKNENFAFSLIADVGGISAVDTAVSVTSTEGALFPQTGSFMAVIWGSAYPAPSLDPNREIVKMSLTSGDTFTIVRAQEGTSASAWAQNDNIAHVLTRDKIIELETTTQNNTTSFAAATGTNTYTAVLDPAITAYVHGMAVNLRFVNASTGVCTLGLNALAAKKVYVLNSVTGAFAQAGSGDIIAGMYSTAFYDSSLDSSAGGWIISPHKISYPTSFDAGTGLLFPQASAPTGWTLDTSWGTPRSLTLGNSYGNGGADSAISYTTNVTVNDHSQHTHTGPNHNHTITVAGHQLTLAQIPSHSHLFASGPGGGWDGCGGGNVQTSHAAGNCGYRGTTASGSNQAHNHSAASANSGTGNTGLGGPTTHTVNQSTYSPRYVQVIRATKD